MKLAIVAAKFTPEEANGLRRAMATFRNVGTIDTFREKMVGGMMRARLCRRISPNAASSRSRASAPTAFPKATPRASRISSTSRPGSRCHHPAAFACALLNSQPMGFYAPAEIVRDAREHGVEVLPPDVNFSDWDNTLEHGERRLARCAWAFARSTASAKTGRKALHGAPRQWLSRPSTSCAPGSDLPKTRFDHSGRSRQLPLDRHGPPRNPVGGAPSCPTTTRCRCSRRTMSKSSPKRTIAPLAADAAERACARRLPDAAPVA